MSAHARPVAPRAAPAIGQGAGAAVTLEHWAAMAVVVAVALRVLVWLDIPVGLVVAAMLLPVTARHLGRHRWAVAVAVLCVAAAVAGLVITELRGEAIAVSSTLRISQTAHVLGIPLVLAALLWARSLLGTQRVVLLFALGSLASVALRGVNEDNIWKFSLSVPVALLALSLPWIWGSRLRQFACLAALTAVSAAADSRSLAAMLVIAAALTLFARRSSSQPDLIRGAWPAILRLGLIALAAYFAVQAAILEGMLGEAARERTELQIGRSGTALVGGRPEMGAAAALIAARPLGYGAGALATYDERGTGKEGMWSLGYDPNNGYVDNYMFGNGIEVHSVLGDLWLHHGLAGAALAIGLLIAILHSAGAGIATSAISSVGLFLALRFAWDFALSPLPSALLYLPITLAVLLPLRDRPS